MLLKRRNSYDERQFVCSLTEELDKACGFIEKNKHITNYRNYLYDCRDNSCNAFGIRLPGCTTGDVQLNQDSVITKIEIYPQYIGEDKLYPEDINDRIRYFVGYLIVIDK